MYHNRLSSEQLNVLSPSTQDPSSKRAHYQGCSQLRFIDLCAGLGGFHYAFELAKKYFSNKSDLHTFDFKCVFACEIDKELRKTYLNNFLETKAYYKKHFPSEWASELGMDLYDEKNSLIQIHGDLASLLDLEKNSLKRWPKHLSPNELPILPEHDILCAGFPCQPFSKSGNQKGFNDTRGTVFGMLKIIIEEHRPAILLLENVGNFERHDQGNTWKTVLETLEALDYKVHATTHVSSGNGSQGLLSPHHLGLPHHRERFFIVATHPEKVSKLKLETSSSPFPQRYGKKKKNQEWFKEVEQQAELKLKTILKKSEQLASATDLEAAKISTSSIDCINHWNSLLGKIDGYNKNSINPICMPSFPIWGFELDPWNWYPIEENPQNLKTDKQRLLKTWCNRNNDAQKLLPPPSEEALNNSPTGEMLDNWFNSWPAYANKREKWPEWKIRFITQNRTWATELYQKLDRNWFRDWLNKLSNFTHSMQKLEWNCKGEELDLTKHILQFRPSGLRVKRLRHVPAFVAMTTTQIPIVPIQQPETVELLAGDMIRYLMPMEALQFQGLPYDWHTPPTKEASFKAFGNAVHAEVVKEIILGLLQLSSSSPRLPLFHDTAS